jgi:hypothetical protein
LFAYADGTIDNLTTADITGSYLVSASGLVVETDDCPDGPGSYTLRVDASGSGAHLSFTTVDDACTGRSDDLSFGPWTRLDD